MTTHLATSPTPPPANSALTPPIADSPLRPLPDSPPRSPSLPWPATWTLLLALAALAASTLSIALHGHPGFFTPTLALLITLTAALFDGHTSRIPNPLTYTAILLGLSLNTLSALSAQGGGHSALSIWLAAPGLQQSLLGFATCASLGLLAFSFAHIGGGDIKLLAALGALLGLSAIGPVMLLALLIALAYALLNLALVGRLNTLARLTSQRLLELLYFRRLATAFDDPQQPSAKNIPMAIPLATALLLSQLLDLSHLLGGNP